MRVIAAWVAGLLAIVGIGVGVEAGIGTGDTSGVLTHNAAPVTSTSIGHFRFYVFVSPSATPGQVAVIRAFLRENIQVSGCRYLDKAQSYELMKRVLAQDLQAVEAVPHADVPTLFSCAFRGSRPALLARQLEALPDIFSVTAPLGTGLMFLTG
jgi:type IV secretory pathway protease TraF